MYYRNIQDSCLCAVAAPPVAVKGHVKILQPVGAALSVGSLGDLGCMASLSAPQTAAQQAAAQQAAAQQTAAQQTAKGVVFKTTLVNHASSSVVSEVEENVKQEEWQVAKTRTRDRKATNRAIADRMKKFAREIETVGDRVDWQTNGTRWQSQGSDFEDATDRLDYKMWHQANQNKRQKDRSAQQGGPCGKPWRKCESNRHHIIWVSIVTVCMGIAIIALASSVAAKHNKGKTAKEQKPLPKTQQTYVVGGAK